MPRALCGALSWWLFVANTSCGEAAPSSGDDPDPSSAGAGGALNEPGGDGGSGTSSGSRLGMTGGAKTGNGGNAGAGGMAGGPRDAGGVDGDAAMAGFGGAPVLGGDSKCTQSHFQLCESFESGTIDPSIWSVDGQPPTIDNVRPARGKNALHIENVGGSVTHIRESKTFREPDNTYFGRVFIYFKSLPTPKAGFGYSHWTLLAATGDGPGGGGEIRFGGQMEKGVNRFGVGTDNQQPGATGDWTNFDHDPTPDGSTSNVPTGQWLCVEWMHAGPPANQTKMWWDGTEHTSIATTKTSLGVELAKAKPGDGMTDFVLPNFTSVWLGWQAYQGSDETFELWMDEIAIDHTRIGCGN